MWVVTITNQLTITDVKKFSSRNAACNWVVSSFDVEKSWASLRKNVFSAAEGRTKISVRKLDYQDRN